MPTYNWLHTVVLYFNHHALRLCVLELLKVSFERVLSETFDSILMASRESVLAWNLFIDILSCVPTRLNRIIREKVLYSQLNYADRCYIAAFCFQNGVSPYVVGDFLWMNSHCTQSKRRKVLDLYNYWSLESDEGYRRRSRYNAYDIIIGRICDLNGEIVSNLISQRTARW